MIGESCARFACYIHIGSGALVANQGGRPCQWPDFVSVRATAFVKLGVVRTSMVETPQVSMIGNSAPCFARVSEDQEGSQTDLRRKDKKARKVLQKLRPRRLLGTRSSLAGLSKESGAMRSWWPVISDLMP